MKYVLFRPSKEIMQINNDIWNMGPWKIEKNFDHNETFQENNHKESWCIIKGRGKNMPCGS